MTAPVSGDSTIAMQYQIGTIAGQIWQYLDVHGSATVLKIKAVLGISNSMLYLGLGWLAREDKIEIVEHDHTFKISLKQ
jgi:hypothetical protein